MAKMLVFLPVLIDVEDMKPDALGIQTQETPEHHTRPFVDDLNLPLEPAETWESWGRRRERARKRAERKARRDGENLRRG